jgi:hypothetical protein
MLLIHSYQIQTLSNTTCVERALSDIRCAYTFTFNNIVVFATRRHGLLCTPNHNRPRNAQPVTPLVALNTLYDVALFRL